MTEKRGGQWNRNVYNNHRIEPDISILVKFYVVRDWYGGSLRDCVHHSLALQ